MDKKFERKTEQKHPTNPTGNRNIETNKVDIDEKTIKDQQNKKYFKRLRHLNFLLQICEKLSVLQDSEINCIEFRVLFF